MKPYRRIGNGVARVHAVSDGGIALHFQGHQRIQRDIHAVFLRPDSIGIAPNRPGSDFHRNLVFIVVLREVGTQTDENPDIARFEVIGRLDIFSMDVHLQVVELAQVV